MAASGGYGCTVTSVAMGLSAFAIDVTPGELNARLDTVHGYDDRGRLRWAAIAELFPGVRADWQRPLTHDTLDAALRNREPIVARITLSSGIEHWVLVVGKHGHDYVVRDPLDPDRLTPLDAYGSSVRAVRVLSRVM